MIYLLLHTTWYSEGYISDRSPKFKKDCLSNHVPNVHQSSHQPNFESVHFFMCWCIYQKNLLRDLYLKVFLSNLLSPKHLEKNKSLGQREPFVITAVNRRLQGRDGI